MTMNLPKNKFRIERDVVWIELTQGREALVDLADWPRISQYRWYAYAHPKGWVCARGYTPGKLLSLTTFTLGLKQGVRCTHINGNSLDCRRSNVRWNGCGLPMNEFRIEGDVVWIKLTQGKETCVDLADWPMVSGYKWHFSGSGSCRYAMSTRWVGDKKERYLLHRLILPGVPLVDHKDCDGLNNRRSNLRAATARQNSGNSRKIKPASSRFKGVSFDKKRNKWVAGIAINLGRFDSEEEAARVYDVAAAKIHGEFARLNFPAVVDN